MRYKVKFAECHTTEIEAGATNLMIWEITEV